MVPRVSLSPEMSANRLFDATLSAIRDFTYTFDREGRFLYANKALLDLWGFSLAEAVGKTFSELPYPPELAEKLAVQIEQVFTTKEIVRDETVYVSPDGVYGYYEYIFSPVLNELNEVVVVAGSTRDITKHKRVELELRETQRRMDAALEGGQTGTWSWDLATNEVRIDRNVASFFSLSADEVSAGLTMTRILAAVHEDDREHATRTLHETASSGRNFHSEYRIAHPSRDMLWVVSRGTPHIDENGKTRSMTGTVTDITERHWEERHTRFLGDLSVEVSALSGADDITRHTLEAVGKYLNVQRAYFFEPLPQKDRILVTQNWNRPEVPSLAGEYDLMDFGTPDWWDKVRTGPIKVNNTAAEPNVDEKKYTAIQIRAWATVPYSREGRWVAGIAISSSEPREWTAAELDLLSNVMARIWPMIERARLVVIMRANQSLLSRQRDALEKVIQGASLLEILDSLANDFEQSSGRHSTAAFLLIREDGVYLQAVAGGRCDADWLRYIENVPVGPGPESGGAAAYSRERVIIPDILKSPRWDDFREEALKANIRACWSTPVLSTRGTVLGTFAVYYREPSAPLEHEIASSDILVRTAAIAIERDLARRALEKSQQDLADANQELEARVQERTARLKETIEELEAFSYSISHDLRAPLRAMQGYASVLLEDAEDGLSAERKDYLGRIKRASERLDHLINDILRYTRVTRAEVVLHSVDLNSLIRDLIREYPQLHDKGVSIDVAPLPLVHGHEVLLSQCFSNLLTNAVKFVPPGKTPVIKIWPDQRLGRVRVWIQDNGIGLEAKDLTRIFGMFERVNPPKMFEGTGIGLTIVKRAMERMAGTIGVEASLGEGSRFWIELPTS